MSIRQTLQKLAAAQGLALAVLCMAAPDAASAYVGPGAGLTVIGSVVAVVAALLIAVLGLVVFPIRLLMRKLREGKGAQSAGEA